MEEKLKVGKIYKLIDNTNGNIYIGSTTQKLNQRLNEHKSDYRTYLNGKRHYTTSFNIIKNNDYKIELIQFVIFKNKKELHQRERYYIENNICVNKCIPTRTKKEYHNGERYKEYRKKYDKEYYKEYYIDNKDQIKERNKIKYQCECGLSIRIDGKQRHFKTNIHINFINSK
jgi:hypothetical protein